MEFRQLNYFITVANKRSYSLAAKELFVTQPTLTLAIKKLEKEFNTTLFEQNNRRLELTESGQMLYEKGIVLLKSYNNLIDEMNASIEESREVLKVGLTVLFAIQYMEEISSFIARHPKVELSLIQHGSKQLQRMVANGDLDLGLLSFPQYERGIVMKPIERKKASYVAAIVVPSNHPLENKEEITIEDLKDVRISSLTKNYVLGNEIYVKCRERGFEPNIVFSDDNWTVLVKSIEIFDSVAILPAEFEDISQFQNTKWIPLAEKMEYKVGIAHKKDEDISEIGKLFIDYILSEKIKKK